LAPGERRGRGAAKPFPTATFEEVLILPKGVADHGAGDRIRRMTLFDKLGRSPESGLSRTLVTNSARYGLTNGSYQAEFIELTDEGKHITDGAHDGRAVRQTMFKLALEQFEPFSQIYERLKNRRIPSEDVLRDEFGQVGISAEDRELAARVFLANARHLGLIQEVSGTERLISIEHVVEQLADDGNHIRRPQPPDDPRPGTTQPPSLPPPALSPSVHIDIQIHIDSSATEQQIDQIFASMARHLYGREA
jgi:hypothetical protein